MFVAAFAGAVVAHGIEGVFRLAWRRWRRRSILSEWRKGADRAQREHPLVPELPRLALELPRAWDLDTAEGRAAFEREHERWLADRTSIV
jgi:hypothetical protein